MSTYIDVYVLPVQKTRVEDYRSFAGSTGKVWREYGALDVVEIIAEDVKSGVHTSFPHAVKLQPDEVAAVAGSHSARERTATGSTLRS